MSDIDALVETVRGALLDTSNALVPGTMTERSHGALATLDELAGIARECLDVLHSTEAYERALTAEAERDRLKAALREILRMGDYVYKPHEFAEIARAALADVGGTEETSA